ncbi:MAG: hypothetical protein J1F03_04805 [Oscillospiraceae bacterium]|nr:hypothetical protein [Oscillospiraceae bacterium]
MSKRVKFGLVVAALLAILGFYFTIIKGISELFAETADPDRASRGDVIEYRVLFAKEVLEIRHMLFGIIPTYSERFYITTNEDGLNSLLVRADEKWFEENFTSDGLAKSPVKISALIKSASSKNGFSVTSINAQLGSLGRVDAGQYADAEYVSEATLKIISGILLITSIITCVLMLLLVLKGVLKKGGAGVSAMAIAAIIQMAGFIIIMFAI